MKKYLSMKGLSCVVLLSGIAATATGQQKPNDVTAPLHALQPDYPVSYTIPTTESIKSVVDRVYHYLDSVTPAQFIHRKTGETLGTSHNLDSNAIFKPGDFRLTSYEWGVTYSGMLQLTEATGDRKYAEYFIRRMELLSNAYPTLHTLYLQNPSHPNPMRQVIAPKALDDAGAMCAAMIKLIRTGGPAGLRPMADNYINYISTKEYRLRDGTLARNRPQKNTLWLDDLYMAVPALSQMGKLSGNVKYYDDAVKQVLQFSNRMFNEKLNVYMHGWVEGMSEHPQFHWARANGWALMAMTELLDVLPASHTGRKKILDQFRLHVKGLASFQTGKGFWHQLLDKNDSYLETSATAIYTYCIARGINKGWIDAKAYAPMVLLGWSAVSTKINSVGQVEGTCVGTGMAFDPAFYYYRPVNVYAAHGYGPVLLAGSEVINLLGKHSFEFNDSSIQLKEKQ